MSTWVRRRAGVRERTSLVATVVVAATLALSSLAFVLFLKRSLSGALDEALLRQAQTTVSSLQRGDGVSSVLQPRVGGSNLVQLLAGDGHVLGASSSLLRATPLVATAPQPGEVSTSTRSVPGDTDEDSNYRVLALGLTGADGSDQAVVVAQSLDAVRDSTHRAGKLLLIGSPLLLLAVASLTHWLAGRALAPVERIRRQVAGIDATTLSARVPVPEPRDEVRELAGTMNQMLDRLDAAAAAQRRFLSDASHELRSPLAALRTTVEVALAHPAGADPARTGAVVLEEAARLERLVADLLLLARADETGLLLSHQEVDLDDLLMAECERLRSTSQLQVGGSIAAVRVRGDADALARAVRNLVDNASRYARTRVELSVRVADGKAEIDVRDDGPGIPSADRVRVFERFVRLDESRSREGGGTGLGLAIVQQIAHAHGGDVTVVDTAEGALLRLRLALP